MSPYAEGTSVSKGRTLVEIERILMRFGCTEFAQGTRSEPPMALIGFTKDGLSYRVTLPLPSPDRPEFTHSPAGRRRYDAQESRARWEQGTMERWRALALYVKAMVVAVESGIVSFETAFLPYMLGPGGRTVAEECVPQALEAAAEGRMPSFGFFGTGPKALPEARKA